MSGIVKLKRNGRRDYHFDESIKTLRTNVLFSGANLKAVMVTSTVPGEGKSEIAFSLAVSLAQLGKRVLMIDADIRKSVLVTRYGVEAEIVGLSQYLSGQRDMEEIFCQTNIPDFTIVFAGPFSPNPAELLESEQFARLIEFGKENYDFVIIDTPPLGGIIDGAIVATQCDGAVLVVEAEKISRKMVVKAKEQLERSGCQILGAVLNKAGNRRGGSYEYSYKRYYGKYGNYYE